MVDASVSEQHKQMWEGNNKRLVGNGGLVTHLQGVSKLVSLPKETEGKQIGREGGLSNSLLQQTNDTTVYAL